MIPRRDVAVLGFCLALAAAYLLQLVDFGYGRDQAIYSTAARSILHGGTPYRDIWDFKPPGIFFLYALVQSISESPHAIRILEAAAIASYIPAFILLSRRFVGSGRAGLIGGTLAVLCHVQLEFWHTAQPESFGGVVLAWALVVSSNRPRRVRCLFSAGVLTGVAVVLKPTIGLGCLPLLVLSIIPGSAASPFRWKRLVAAAAGLMLPFAACAWFFAGHDGLAAFREIQFTFVPNYVAFSWASTEILPAVWSAVRQWLFDYSLPNLAGLILLATIPSTTSRREGIIWIGSTLSFLLIGVILQAKFFAYHFGAILPLTSLLAGWGVSNATLRIERPLAMTVAAAGALMVLLVNPNPPDLGSFAGRSYLRAVAWLSPAQRNQVRDRLYSVGDFQAADNRAASEWIASNVGIDGCVFVWGFAPNIYVDSHRMPASRYVYNLAQRSPWSQTASRAILMADLERSMPGAILVEHDDRFPLLTGSRADSAEALREFRELATMLARSYRLQGSIGKFDAYRALTR